MVTREVPTNNGFPSTGETCDDEARAFDQLLGPPSSVLYCDYLDALEGATEQEVREAIIEACTPPVVG